MVYVFRLKDLVARGSQDGAGQLPYDFVVLDTPPVLAVSAVTGQNLAHLMGAVVEQLHA